MAMLRADEADFAVGSMLDMPDDVSYFPVFEFEPTLITPLGHPLADQKQVTLEDIAKSHVCADLGHKNGNVVINVQYNCNSNGTKN